MMLNGFLGVDGLRLVSFEFRVLAFDGGVL